MPSKDKIIGFLDSYQDGHACGWALNADSPEAAVDIEILRDDKVIASGKTGHARPDLEKINPVIKNQGFVIKIANLEKFSTDTALTARDALSKKKLEGIFLLPADPSLSLKKDAESHYLSGKQFFESKDWKSAESAFKQALGSGCDKKDTHWLLAVAITRMGRTWESLHYYKAAHEADPKNVEKLLELSRTQERMEYTEDAVVSLRKLCTLDPKNPDHYYALGCNLRKTGDINGSEAAYAKAANFDRSLNIKKFGIGAFHARRGAWAEAITDYRDEITKQGNTNPALFYRLGMAYEKMYLWNEAIQYYKQAVALDGCDHYWHYRLGLCLERRGLWHEAAEALHNAAKRNEKFEPSLYAKAGELFAKANEFEKSSSVYIQSRVLDKDYGIDASKDRLNEGFRATNDYTEFYRNNLLDTHSILYESYHGASISCNPYAIFKALIDNPDFSGWTHVWVINERNRIPNELRSLPNLIFVKKESDLYRFYLTTCKYLINNSTFPTYFMRKPEQVYLNTWHGTPQKTLFKDIHEGNFGHKNIARNFLHCTHIIAPNLHTESVLFAGNDIAEIYPGEILRTGYPRIDLMLNATGETKSSILKKLSINNRKPVVLFAPTYRENQTDADVFQLQADIESLVSAEYTLLFRGHYFVEEKLSKVKSSAQVVPQEIDTCELLSVVDILITDYSSIYFDFLPKKKPIVFYVPDYDKYKAERGLYFERSSLPGATFDTVETTKNHIQKILKQEKSALHTNHKNCLKQFSKHEDGTSTQEVISAIFNTAKKPTADRPKKNLLFFAGAFIPNGITSSFVNLIKSIDTNKYSITVAIDPAGVLSNPDRIEQINRILPNVAVVARCGRMNITIEEKWIAAKLGSSYTLDTEALMRPYQESYRREFLRTFGYAHFDSIINFEGYSQFWTSLLGLGPTNLNVKKTIYLHSNMHEEMKTRFPNLRSIISFYNFYDGLISVSSNVRQENLEALTDRFTIPPSKFRYVRNTLLPNDIVEKSKEHEPCHDLPWPSESTYTYLTLGRLSPEKDHEKLIRAFKTVHTLNEKARLVIAGQGPLRSYLESLIRKLELVDYVFLAGQQLNPFPLFAKADCFVLSSNHEGQGMVLLEAMTLGKPIVSTDVSGPRSVLEDGYGMLVENTVTALADGMRKIPMSKEQFKRFDATSYVKTAMNQFYQEI
ncbi:CDP-glycerol glycerophosphotransferase family protein [Pseudomonas sp. UBA6562]|uniref:CDP-glycerol glycerophosphotransferase family protein n=1 Tax=Pseudomonas sp. UBA6562 TaxID=1947332 RepID=UPI0025DA021C|nr:CDP-glycerol glycerophosphotransferase family protein [Pseudomonas sp. UBA6562]